MIKFHGISMPEGAALSWPFSDIVIRRKNGFDFRCRVRGCSLLDQRPVSLRVFGCLPVTARGAGTEAGVRKASKEETAGSFAPAVVSVYGDLMRGSESASSLSGKEAGRVSDARVIVAGLGAERRVLSR